MSPDVRFPRGDPIATAEQLEALAADLRRLAGGRYPDVQGRPGTPLMLKWGIGQRANSCLDGIVYGHPLLPDGARMISSEVYAIDRARGWARTASRFYEIGPARMFGVDQ